MNAAGATWQPSGQRSRPALYPGAFAFLLGLFFLGLTDVQVIPVLLPAFESGFSVSIAAAGSLVTLYSLAAALSALVVGPLSDRFGRMRFIRAGAGLFALAALLGAMADRFWSLAAARMMAGAAGGIFSACIVALIADRFTFDRRGRAMGWVAGMYSLSAVVGVPAGAFVTGAFGWRAIFWCFGLLALLLTLILPRLAESQERAGASGTPAPWRFVRQQALQYLTFWKRPAPRRGLWLAIAVVSSTTSLITYLAAWLVDGFGYTMTEVGVVFLVTGGAMVLGSVAGGWLSDRLGKRFLLAGWSALLAPVLLAVVAIESRGAVLLYCLAGGLLLSLREAPYQAVITELVPTEQRGAYLAMRSTTAKMAIAASALVAGHLFEHLGFVAVAGFSALCSGAVFLIAAGRLRLPAEEPPDAGDPSETQTHS